MHSMLRRIDDHGCCNQAFTQAGANRLRCPVPPAKRCRPFTVLSRLIPQFGCTSFLLGGCLLPAFGGLLFEFVNSRVSWNKGLSHLQLLRPTMPQRDCWREQAIAQVRRYLALRYSQTKPNTNALTRMSQHNQDWRRKPTGSHPIVWPSGRFRDMASTNPTIATAVPIAAMTVAATPAKTALISSISDPLRSNAEVGIIAPRSIGEIRPYHSQSRDTYDMAMLRQLTLDQL